MPQMVPLLWLYLFRFFFNQTFSLNLLSLLSHQSTQHLQLKNFENYS